MATKELREQQETLADKAFEAYRFGDELTVTGSEDWKQDTFDGKDDWTKVVYVEVDDPRKDGTHMVSFHAAFAEGTPVLDEAYAYWCETGAEIGEAGAAANDGADDEDVEDDEPSGVVVALHCADGSVQTVAAEDITEVTAGLVKAGLQLYAVTPESEETARRVLEAYRGR